MEYRERYHDKINTRLKEFNKKRKKRDLSFKLICNIRTRTNKVFGS